VEYVNFWEWSSHQPFLQTVMDVVNPKQIVELGIGKFSTPILIENKSNEATYLGIENNLQWFNEIAGTLSIDPSIQLRLHDIGNRVTNATFLKDLTEIEKKDIINYYFKLSFEIKQSETHPSFCFVDNYTCCRATAINTLFSFFDMIGYHDCQEPAAIPWYEYYFVPTLKETYDQYTLKTPISWTGCFIHKNFRLNMIEFNERLEKNVYNYCKINSLNCKDFMFEKRL
jgi:hypothetical protein